MTVTKDTPLEGVDLGGGGSPLEEEEAPGEDCPQRSQE